VPGCDFCVTHLIVVLRCSAWRCMVGVWCLGVMHLALLCVSCMVVHGGWL